MALDDWIAVRRWMVVQEAARVFSASRMVWSAWMVACLTICSCGYVLVLHNTIPSVQNFAMWLTGEQPPIMSLLLMSPRVSNTRVPLILLPVHLLSLN